MKKSKASKPYRVINIRGANGAGKSHIIRKLIVKFDAKPVYKKAEPGEFIGQIIGYRGIYKGEPVYLVGPYEVQSGGCDWLSSKFGYDYIDRIVRRFSKKGNVLFEGFMVSTIVGRYVELSNEVGDFVWAFLDTPLNVCLKRISERNAIGNEGNTISSRRSSKPSGTKRVGFKHKDSQRIIRNARKAKQHVVIIDYKKPVKEICRLLRNR